MTETQNNAAKTTVTYEAHLMTSIGGIVEFNFTAESEMSDDAALELAIRKSGLEENEVVSGSWAKEIT